MTYKKVQTEKVAWDLDGKDVQIIDNYEIHLSLEEALKLTEYLPRYNEVTKEFIDLVYEAKERLKEDKRKSIAGEH